MDTNFFGFERTPFSVTPDPEFFYTNAAYQEALETLRYGIENRKGLMVVTGEIGIGKTVLLRKLTCGLDATAHCVFIFNTHLSFFDLLQLVFRDLDLEMHGEGSLAMMEELRNYLIAQFEKGRIVSLLIDEAQNLSDEAFEGVRFLSTLETDKERLLQIILVGQPELETRLDQPELQALKQRVAVQCRLYPIEDEEVGSYIAFRLKSAGCEAKGPFSPGAIERIAFYAGGSPRLINTICDNGLRIACAASRKEVNPEIIDRVARDLRLRGQTREKREKPASLSRTNGNGKIVGAPNFRGAAERSQERQPKAQHQGRSSAVQTGIFLAVVLFAGASMALTSGETRDYLWDLQMTVKRVLGSGGEGPLEKKMAAAGSDVGRPLPEKELPPRSENRNLSPVPEPRKPAAKSAPSRGAGITARSANRISRDRVSVKTPADPEAARKRLQIQVAEAVHKRSITGVEVSVNGSSVYLDGLVEFQAQKWAAERAAHKVPGVKSVRNRIVVGPLPAY